jgi:hypothetical protein
MNGVELIEMANSYESTQVRVNPIQGVNTHATQKNTRSRDRPAV